MRFDPPLLRGTLLRRYKRFFADIELADGRQVTAHCPNSGSMAGVAVAGQPVAVTPHNDPKRKLQFTWEMIQLGRTWVGVHTQRPNALVAQAIAAGELEGFSGYDQIRREVRYGQNSRIDLLLSGPGRTDCYVEIKNVTMAEGTTALFPDAVTERGQKHLSELMAVVRSGQRAILLFWVNRNDCDEFQPADQIDPRYGQLLRQAAAQGVELLAIRARVNPQQACVDRPIPVALPCLEASSPRLRTPE